MTLRKNIIASWLAHVVTLLIGFVSMPLIMHALGEDTYGVWLFINSAATYSGLLYLGFGATICREVANSYAKQEWEELNTAAATVFSVYSGMSLVLLACGGIFAAVVPWLPVWGDQSIREVQWVVLILSASLAIGMLSSVFGGVLVGTQRIDRKRSVEVVSAITRLCLVMICLKQRPTLTTMALIFLATTVLETSLYYVMARWQVPTLSISPRLVTRESLKRTFSFSLTYIVGQFAEQLIYMTDTVVVGLVFGTKAVVPYYIALRICQLIQQPLAQVGEAFLPKAGHLHAAGESRELARVLVKMAGLCFLLASAFWIGACYFSEMLIRVWLKTDPIDSYPVLMILLTAQVVALPLVVFRKGLLAIGEIRVQTYIDLAEAGLNLLLSVALAYLIGRIGVAWGTLIPLVLVESCVLLPYAARKLDVSLLDLLLKGLAPHIVPIACLWGFCVYVTRLTPADGWLNLLVITTGGGAVLGASWWMVNSALNIRTLSAELRARS